MVLDFSQQCRYLTITVPMGSPQANGLLELGSLLWRSLIILGTSIYDSIMCKSKYLYRSRTALCGFKKMVLRPCCSGQAGEGIELAGAPASSQTFAGTGTRGIYHSISLRRGVSEEVTAQVKVQLESKEAFSISDVSGWEHRTGFIVVLAGSAEAVQ